MEFTGIPLATVDFYAELNGNNNREWWLAHKAFYDESIRDPFRALAAQVGPAFGDCTVYRPNRDVRFSNDKTPYTDHQGLFARAGKTTGWYFHLDENGIFLGGGCWWMAGDQLSRFRSAIANYATGVQLEAILRDLVEAGYEVGGEQLVTRPRGVAADAPRLDLLRRKALTVSLKLGAPDWLATPEAAEYLNDGWDEVRPLVEWLVEYVGESETQSRR